MRARSGWSGTQPDTADIVTITIQQHIAAELGEIVARARVPVRMCVPMCVRVCMFLQVEI